ncbi:uncharacterized protein LOC117641400 [Thrips palmi]|uniref:Uncharacterized protein LOC117641400 n=1 Tax=Thrips palmi TaxID=161013 RepID=A0A6P8YCL4_THRPL|nr:uncharacterized protein LOC117641400 [Thrips palmi]XP_034234575.1 uncharacterized protein LOC117641400 [Thrips palmi]XP_034234576.1 uncharacterized protein LOC117641400 [Thrips palmi]
MGRLGGNRRIALRKRFTKSKQRSVKKNPDTCLTDESGAEHISDDVQAVTENPPLTQPVHCPDTSTLTQARASTPTDQFSAHVATEQPCCLIDTYYSIDNNLSTSPADCKAIDASLDIRSLPVNANQSVNVPFEVQQINSVREITKVNQSASTHQWRGAVPFKVAEIKILEDTSECPDTSCELQLSSSPEPILAKIFPSSSNICNLEEVETRLKHSLPPYWQCINWTVTGDNGISLLKLADSMCFLPQRQIHISENGVVHLFVHGKPLGLDHEIWGKLPERISLSTHAVDESFEYALAIWKLVRRYDICAGCNQPQEQPVANKMERAVFSPNMFRESKYSTTYRSVDCGLLVIPVTRNTVCSACRILRSNIRKRISRQAIKDKKEV